ncbi:LEA type 2 family protein [Candidatus Margulisiibacteriota bacterium]
MSCILVIGLSGCQFSEPKANYIDSKVTKVTLQGAEVEFYFEVENPNPLDIEISEFSYRVFINGRQLLDEHRPGFAVGPNSNKKITLPVFVRYDRVFDSLLGIAAKIMSGQMEIDYKIEGSMMAGTTGVRVPVALGTEGTIKIPKN